MLEYTNEIDSTKLISNPTYFINSKANTSLKPHWYCPYSFDANKKLKLKLMLSLFRLWVFPAAKKFTSKRWK